MDSRTAAAWIGSLLLLAGLALPHEAFSQTNAEGSIRGIVRDEQGAVLPGATVSAVGASEALPVSAVTDSTGAYRLLTLQPGTYTVKAQLQGFSESLRNDVIVRAGLNVGLDVVMHVGSLTEAVSIVADTPLLESRRAGTALNISGDFQRALPISARQHFYDFLALSPGTTVIESPIS